MNRSQKALVTKELQKASAALDAAFQMIARSGDHNLDIMKTLREERRNIGAMIVTFNGGPVVTVAELVH